MHYLCCMKNKITFLQAILVLVFALFIFNLYYLIIKSESQINAKIHFSNLCITLMGSTFQP